MNQKTVCRFCDHECPVTVELAPDGEPVRLHHERAAEGFFCPGGVNALEMMHSPARIKTPLIAQRHEDGTRTFHPATWEEALDLTASRLLETAERFGPESIMAVSGFNKPLHRAAFQRFCNVTGIINRVGSGNMCHMVQNLGITHTFGTGLKPNVNKETRTIVLWGLNPANTMRWDSRTLLDGVKGGARLVLVDPLPGIYADKADVWLPLIPGTDLALLLSLIHVIVDEGWYDREFVEKYTLGLEEICAAAQPYTPEYAGSICGLEPDVIRRAARQIADSPTAFFCGNALHHNQDCYQKCRAIAILMALTGNADRAGAMLPPPPPSPRSAIADGRLHRADAFPEQWHSRRLGCGKYTLKEYRMVSGQEAVQAIQDGVIRAGYVHAGDPVLQWADSKATARALGSMDFLAVSDFLMTPTARQADVIFPAATYLEYESLVIDEQENLRYSPRLSKQYDVLPDFEILRRLAERMGKGEDFWPDAEAYWDAVAQPYGLTFDEVRHQGYVETPYQPESPRVRNYQKEGFPTDDGKIHLALSARSDGPDPVPVYAPLEGDWENYPLHATTYKPGPFFGGAGQTTRTQLAMQPDPICYLSAATADRYGIQDGSNIRISTPTGSCVQRVCVLPRMAADTVALANARWNSETENWERQLSACANNLSSMEQNTGRDIPAFATRGIPCRIEKV